MGAVLSRGLVSTGDEVNSGQGLPGMIPADLAAKSIALDSVVVVEVLEAGGNLDTEGLGAGVRRVWIGRNDPVPVAEEFERMEKEHTCCEVSPVVRGRSVL